MREGQAASAAASAAAVAPSSGRDAVTHTPANAVRRGTSRAAAQAVISKVMQPERQASAGAATGSEQLASTDPVARVAERPAIAADTAAEPARPSAKLTVARPQVADTISIAGAVTSGRADTGAGEHRSAGQGNTGQDAGAQPKQLLGTAAPASVVVAPQDLRQAFERMVRDVTSPTSTLDASAGAAVNDQIVRGMQLQMKGTVGEARITLAPEHLGEVVVEMRVEKDGVVATLRADTPAVRGWLATHQDDLRAGLADVGLRLDDLQVSERDSQRGRQQPPAEQQPHTPRRARRTSTGEMPRFEVEA
jgi:flagellar hook-length control protein FliK